MRRVGIFLVLFGVSAAALLLAIIWYLSSYQRGYSSMAGMMGQMMGNGNVQGMIAPMPGYIWATLAALFVLIAVGVAGTVYYVAYPEIRVAPAGLSGTGSTAAIAPGLSKTKQNWETVLRTSNTEEKRVLEVLASHSGVYLQKFIVKESGLSRLKTHRILSRFAERGIIVAAKSGNTNQVALAPWLMQDAGLSASKA